jgi:streptogramin lyase
MQDDPPKGVSAVRITSSFAVALFALLLSGCSGVPVTSPTETVSNSVSGVALKGSVHGGQQPITGAHVYLYAANTTGPGSESISLLTSGSGRSEDINGNYYVTTQSDGTFSISEDYSCTTSNSNSNSPVYLYSISGDPGLDEGTNAAIGLMAGLGACGNLSSSELIIVNEVSTIATAYAIAGFATDATHVSSSTSALAETGIADAFSAVANLESLGTGLAIATTPKGNGVPPQQEINALADILAACVNSSGAITGGANPTPCYRLFTNAMNGATAPSETATAAINIAHNPGLNITAITALYGLVTPSAPFQTTLSSAPNDFTVAITFAGGGLDGTGKAPEGLAVDGDGNIWVPNFDSDSLSEFSSIGTALSSSTGFTGAGLSEPTSIAIDIYGNAWVANFLGTSISEFNKNGIGISGPPGFEGSGLNTPYGIAIDDVGHTWVSNFGGNSLSEFSASGTALSGQTGFAGGSLVGPAGIAADTSGNVWAVDFNASNYLLVETNASGAQTADPDGFSGGGMNAPYGIAIDKSGDVWVSNTGGSGSISEFDSSGDVLSGTNGFSGGGVSGPYGIAIDGQGNVWTANRFGYTISEFNSSGTAISSSSGYTSAALIAPYSIAIDPSGNVWVATDNGTASLTEFVGAAVPVVTPLAAGAEYKELGTRP